MRLLSIKPLGIRKLSRCENEIPTLFPMNSGTLRHWRTPAASLRWKYLYQGYGEEWMAYPDSQVFTWNPWYHMCFGIQNCLCFGTENSAIFPNMVWDRTQYQIQHSFPQWNVQIFILRGIFKKPQISSHPFRSGFATEEFVSNCG